jgi:hypothetical protein
LPCGCHAPRCRPRLKAAIGTARRASRQSRLAPAARLTDSARLLASPLMLRSEAVSPEPPPWPPHRSPVAVAPRRRLPYAGVVPLSAHRAALSPSRAVAEQHRRCALAPCTARCMGRPSWATHAGRAHTVHLGRVWFRPRGTQIVFYIFLIYSISCKFKNLCRIHLNSENYEPNFVGRV